MFAINLPNSKLHCVLAKWNANGLWHDRAKNLSYNK